MIDEEMVTMKLMKQFKQKRKSGLGIKALACAFACVFLLSSLIATTLAFVLPTQVLSNEFEGPGEGSVILEKFERDVDGVQTDVRVPGASFLLFQVAEPDDIQIGGVFVTDNTAATWYLASCKVPQHLSWTTQSSQLTLTTAHTS